MTLAIKSNRRLKKVKVKKSAKVNFFGGDNMRMSDLVAEYIKNILEESNGIAEIQRNELANSLGCVPSQINYVLSSRFTQENGYVVESRRGGGGYIRITKVHFSTDKGNIIMHIIRTMGNSLDATSAGIILENLVSNRIITTEIMRIMASAISERAFADIPKEYRNLVRATVLKNMLLTQI